MQQINNVPLSAWYNSGAFSYFNGAIDEFRTYNRALDSNEIQTNFNNNLQKMGSYFNVRKYSSVEPTTTVDTSTDIWDNYSANFSSKQNFNQDFSPVIKADFKVDSSTLANVAIEGIAGGTQRSLGVEHNSGVIKIRKKEGNNISYSSNSLNVQPDTWYTAEFDLSQTEAKVFVYKKVDPKPANPAYTYTVSNWNPQLSFYNRNGNTYIDNVSVQARREVYDYLYDNLNRLTKVTDNTESSTVEYTYDALGNRKTKVNSTGTTSYVYSSANELQSVDNPTGDDITFEYDANGNTTKKTQGSDITNYTYDNKNQLVKVVKPNGDIIEYVYDGNGNRYSKTITPSGGSATTRYYHYDAGGNIVSETDESGGLLVKYVRDTDGQAVSMIQGSNTYYFLYNAHGDVTSVADSSGNVVGSYSYDEFGNLNSNTGNIYNPLRYSGANNAYYDIETGLYKMGARYYNPEVGRWVTRDSYIGEQTEPQSRNRYVYVENNPVAYYDSNGFKKSKPKVKTKTVSHTINYGTNNTKYTTRKIKYTATDTVKKYKKSGTRVNSKLTISSSDKNISTIGWWGAPTTTTKVYLRDKCKYQSEYRFNASSYTKPGNKKLVATFSAFLNGYAGSTEYHYKIINHASIYYSDYNPTGSMDVVSHDLAIDIYL